MIDVVVLPTGGNITMKKLILYVLVVICLFLAFLVGAAGASAQESSECRAILLFPILPVLEDVVFQSDVSGAIYSGEEFLVIRWFTDTNQVAHFLLGDWAYIQGITRPELEGWTLLADQTTNTSFAVLAEGVSFDEDCAPLEITVTPIETTPGLTRST